jgi:hypothetical protein
LPSMQEQKPDFDFNYGNLRPNRIKGREIPAELKKWL